MAARVMYLIKWAERGLRARLDAALHEHEVSTAEYATLSALQSKKGLSSAELARRAFVSAQAMNQIVVALERRGWVERTPDPENGRVLRTHLTPEGRRVVLTCDRATAHVERTLLAELSPAEILDLRDKLQRCIGSLASDAPAEEQPPSEVHALAPRRKATDG
ncbi:MAG: MarR family transcriptional regulator [Polyangiales bacterium]